MTITKWKRPSTNGGENDTAVTYSPFTNLLENFFNDNFLSREFSSFVPAVNVSEDENSYGVELSAPGFKKEDFKVELDNKTLTVSAEHREEKEESKKRTFRRKEFNYGSFRRIFSLPESVNEEKIDAKYENGILKLTLTKKEEAKAKPAKEIKIS
jgi:HSP20 family protein